MPNKIKLVFWNEPNFGDMLSPYIIGKLSGKNIIYKEAYYGVRYCIKKILRLIISGNTNRIKSIHFGWEKIYSQ